MPAVTSSLPWFRRSLSLYDSGATSTSTNGGGDADSSSVVALSSQIALLGDAVSQNKAARKHFVYDGLVYLNRCAVLSSFVCTYCSFKSIHTFALLFIVLYCDISIKSTFYYY